MKATLARDRNISCVWFSLVSMQKRELTAMNNLCAPQKILTEYRGEQHKVSPPFLPLFDTLHGDDCQREACGAGHWAGSLWLPCCAQAWAAPCPELLQN